MSDRPVVVMGAGPIGLSIAYQLARRDIDVVVVERSEVGSGAARTNAGWIVPIMAGPVPAPGVVAKAVRWMLDPESPLRVAPDLDPGHISFMLRMLAASTPDRYARGLAAIGALARGSLALFSEYAADGVEFELHREGVLLAFLSERERDAHMAEYAEAAAFGFDPVRQLTAAQVRDLEPSMSGRVKAGLLSADQAHLDPHTFVDGLAARLARLGVPVRTGERFAHLVPVASSRVGVRTSGGVIDACCVIVAAGSRSAELTEPIGYRMPLRFGRGYGFDLPAAEVRFRRAVYLSEAKVAVTPLARGLRIAGTMEFGGPPERVDARRAAGMLASSAAYFSGGLGVVPRAWSGLRPMTPDGLPVIGCVPGRPGIILATGHAMLGITLAPRTAQVVADMVRTGETPDLLRPFSPARFLRGRARRA